MSSISPRPLRSSTRILMTAMMSSLVSVPVPLSSSRPTQAVEQRLDGVLGRRLARAHHAVDRHLRRVLVRRVVALQRLRDVGALVEVVRVQRLELGDRGALQLLQNLLGDLVVGLGDHLAGRGVDDVGRERAPDDVLGRHGDLLHAAVGELAHVARGDALVLRDDHLAVLADDVELRHLAA